MGRYAAWQEVYSVDESLLGLKEEHRDLVSRGRGIGDAVAGTPGCPSVSGSRHEYLGEVR
jgi:DNA polymerase V